nr:hypothetical protein [Tanacetum cinerariifolium]
MATTIEQQVAMNEALVPSTQRSNLRLPSDIQGMLHIYPRIHGQSFDELPFEEEILDFIRFLGHSATIRTLADININKLYQPWRSFAAIINKCLTGKSSGYDSFWLSQAQILWGLYHTRNIGFKKVIIHHFMSKDPSIPRRNKINWHYVRDDSIFSTIKVVSRHQNTQQYGAILPIELTNDEIRNTKAYKQYYALATGEAVPKPKASARRKRSGSDTSITPPIMTAAAKGKQPAKAKSLSDPSEVARTKAQQLKIVLRRSRQQTHISQPGGSGTDEGTAFKPGVPDVSTDESEEELSWNSSDDDGADDQVKDEDIDKGDEGDKKNQETTKYDEQDDAEGGGNDEEESESDEEDDNAETREEENFDPIPRTPESSEDEGDGEEDQVSSQFVTNMLNPTSDADMESIFATASTSVAPFPITAPTMTPSTVTTITTTSQAPIPPIPIPSEVLQNLPTFNSVFRFDDRLKSLEANFSEYRQTNSFTNAVSNIPSIVHQYMNQQMNEAVRVAIQIQTDRLRDSYQRENDEFLQTIDENIKRIIKEQVKGQVKEQVSRILPRIKQSVNAQLKAKVLTRSSHSSRTSYAVVADLSEMKLKKFLIEKMDGNKSIERRDDDDDQDEGPSARSDRGSKRWREGKEPESASAPLETAPRSAGRSTTGSKSRQVLASESAFTKEPVQTTSQMDEPSYLVFETGADDQPIFQSSQHPEWFSQPKKPPTPDQLEYHLEEVYKATTDQLDWVNPEGQQYPHNLLKPLPLIPDNRGRRVIPFAHFINNDLEYLRGCASSRKYTTSVTKTKAADYGNIKWIEDLVPRTMWIQEPIDYDKHALWGVSYWGRKHQQFYGFAVNREYALDVYSKRRIIAVIDLKIVEWHNYKHLDWILVRRDDDKIYKFKEGDFKRLRLQDIEDMLLILVQGKLSNLTVEERFAFNVSLKMFTRSIDKKNRLMRIDELYKFSDGTLNDVRTALDDRLKGIRMQYLTQTIWRKGAWKSSLEEGCMRETFRCCKGPYDSSYAAPIFNEVNPHRFAGNFKKEIEFSLSIGEIVTHWFTLIVLSALRRSGNENMLGLVILILRSILRDLQVTPTNLDE